MSYKFKSVGVALASAAVFVIAAPNARGDTITMTSGGTTYQFDPVAASADFTNVLLSTTPGVTCSGQLIGCIPINEPSFSPPFPPPPAPDPSQTQAFAISLDSIFFNGGPLTSTTYSQTTNDCEPSTFGFGTWCLAYTYQISPNVPSVAPLTDWTPITTPLPAALPLFATGLGGLGLLGWRRKRKAQGGEHACPA
jgi:hypothetical protein